MRGERLSGSGSSAHRIVLVGLALTCALSTPGSVLLLAGAGGVGMSLMKLGALAGTIGALSGLLVERRERRAKRR